MMYDREEDLYDMKQIGCFRQNVINLLNLNIKAETPIFIGESNMEHIKNRHPYEYEQYLPRIEEIIEEPDYVGQNPSDNSISFVKIYQLGSEYVRVAVRITSRGIPFVKSLHLLSSYNAERYIEKGTLKKLDK